MTQKEAFSAMAPTLQNIIPPELRLASTQLAFREVLKICLWHRAWRSGSSGDLLWTLYIEFDVVTYLATDFFLVWFLLTILQIYLACCQCCF